MSTTESSGWATTRGYMWAMLGTAIGFANLLSFGSHCYRNGGGAFLIPFVIALGVLGIPMLILEGVVGQRTQKPLVAAYGSLLGRRAKMLGWLAVIAVGTIGAFYLMLTAWAVAYAWFSAIGAIPQDTATFFTQDFLQLTGDVTKMGSLSIPAFSATIAVAVFTWSVMVRNIQDGVEKWCSFFLPLLMCMVLLFAAVVIFLPGSSIGFSRYFTPDFSKILDYAVWREVFGQLFFSMSLGLGIVVGYSRHTEAHTSIPRAMMQVAIADFVVSFIAGFVIFGCAGYMAQKSGVSFDEIIANASTFEIGYVIFPQILHTFGPILSAILGVMFFFSLFIAGITGQFSIVESVAGNIQFEFGRNRRTAVTITMVIMTALATIFCFGNGTALIDALEPSVMGDNMLIGGIAQTLGFFWLVKMIRNESAWYREDGRKRLSYYALRIFALPIMITILISSLYHAVMDPYNVDDVIRWGWMAAAIVGAVVLGLNGKHSLPTAGATGSGTH